MSIDAEAVRDEITNLCKLHCEAPTKVEVAVLEDGRVELAVLGLEAPFGSYATGWQLLTDDVDAYIHRHGWRFDRGEWSLSWDGGAVAEWFISEI
jgi:hypothetical protein